MSRRLLEADQVLGYAGRPTYDRIFRNQDDEPVIALPEDGQRKRLSVFRKEELAAEEANGGAGRERAALALSVGMCPATMVAAGIGALVGGPIGAAIAAGVTAVPFFGGIAAVAANDSNSRGWDANLKNVADDWEFTFDNKFARGLKKDVLGRCRPRPSAETPFRVCKNCEDILAGNTLRNQCLGFLGRSNNGCRLCSLIVRICREQNNFGHSMGSFVKRVGSAIVLLAPTLPFHETPILRLFSDIWYSGKFSSQIQVGLPALPKGNKFRFILLRHWVEWCDKKHKCNRLHGKEMPFRLIDVGKSPTDTLRLVSGKTIGQSKHIALSHRWGLTPTERVKYCTTRKNFEAQKREIKCLAPNFRDAVEVARAVGVRYLWIDSLCIIQGDSKDWEEQAGLMENVYSSAYFTIAATSAEDMDGSFLKQKERRNEHICFEDANQVFYATSNLTSFDEEMYWECGHGVYCKDLTRLKTSEGPKKSFRLDSEFPRLLYRSRVGYTLNFIQYLLQDYSKRGITMPQDRTVAIAGLESRITTALGCESRCGIFGTYLHRNLLWRRSGGQGSERIDYKTRKVPPWSWMAYEGGIKFLDSPYGKFMFFAPVEFDPADETALIVQVWEFKNDSSAHGATLTTDERQILDAKGEEAGPISYDTQSREDTYQPLCVIMGRTHVPFGDGRGQTRYHIVVAKESHGTNDTYERIGVGWIWKDYVLLQVKSTARLV